MSAPYSDIEFKCEQAVYSLMNAIAPSLAGATVRVGIDPTEIVAPSVNCNAKSCEEHIYQTGQYAVEIIVEVRSNADDTSGETHRSRVAYVRDQLANDGVHETLSGYVSDFTAIGVILEKGTHTIQDRSWITNIPIMIHCRPSD